MGFYYFIAVFKEVVEKKVDDEQGKLTGLIKYTKEDARDMVENCIQLSPEDGFKTAKHLLNERYEDPHCWYCSCWYNSVDEISFEDRTFVDIVEKKTSKKDYHYVVPLPFRDDRLIMPNNQLQTIKRPMLIRQRLLEDQKFFDDYKKFEETYSTIWENLVYSTSLCKRPN